jgi:hypothetical protein
MERHDMMVINSQASRDLGWMFLLLFLLALFFFPWRGITMGLWFLHCKGLCTAVGSPIFETLDSLFQSRIKELR